MDPSDGILLVSILILVALSGFFSSSETALVGCNRIRLRTTLGENNRKLKILNKVLDNPSKMLSAILIGNNVVNLTASALATTFAMRVGGSTAVGISTGILTLLVLIFGEISPKTAANVHAEKMAVMVAPIIWFCMVVLTPVIFIVNIFSGTFLRLLRVDPNQKPDPITEEDFHTIVDVTHEEGVIEKEEMKMINNVVDFGDSVAKDVMIPRIDMVYVDEDDTYDEVIRIYRENMFTRFPVCKGGSDNVIGILNVKDLLFYDCNTDFRVSDYMREAYYTYEFKRTSELFIDMRQHSVSVAVVLDEYGTTAGLVALEDLLEEIVGEIRDEYDSDELDSVRRIGEGEYLVKGFVKLDDLNDWLEISLHSDDFDSIGGYIIGLLDDLPKVGQSVSRDGFTFRVESLDKNRIETVRMWLPGEEDEPAKERA